jgi:uncharacterized protein YjdB
MKNIKLTCGILLIISLFGLIIVGCDPGTNGETGDFVAVTNITNLPTSATVNIALNLSGTVVPANATNKTISWSVKNQGNTDTSISGSSYVALHDGTSPWGYTSDGNIFVKVAFTEAITELSFTKSKKVSD